YLNAKITDNTIRKSRGRMINVNTFDKLTITGNTLEDIDPTSGFTTVTAMSIGDDSYLPSYNALIANNTVTDHTGKVTVGISIANVTGMVTDNLVNLTTEGQAAGIYV